MDQLVEKGEKPLSEHQFFGRPFTDSELVIGLVGAVGTNLDDVTEIVKNRLKFFKYKDVDQISVSRNFLKRYLPKEIVKRELESEYARIDTFMGLGNLLRDKLGEEILAIAVADHIQSERKKYTDLLIAEGKLEEKDAGPVVIPRKAYIIKSLKNKSEVEALRKIYGNGFYLIGVFEEEEKRKANLLDQKMTEEEAERLIRRDEEEEIGHGQHTRDTFQLADFFVDCSNTQRMKASLHRFLDLIFGAPFATPTFGEYAMFMAYSASLRSADLSRQIGAVICKDDEILASGANDCAKPGGGLYWPYLDKKDNAYKDAARGRDYMRGSDPNKDEFLNIVNDILSALQLESTAELIEKLKKTKLGGLTEYGRVVHAEMEALAMCARNNISCRNGELYAITFPCHNCAKHIIAAGIKKVVYIEPYPKSLAFEMFDDAITKKEDEEEPSWEDKKGKKVLFTPFFGVGPRKYIEFFEMNSTYLPKKNRKDKDGKSIKWERETAEVRSQMLPTSYLDREIEHSYYYNLHRDLEISKEELDSYRIRL